MDSSFSHSCILQYSFHTLNNPCIADIVSLPLILSPHYFLIYVLLKKISFLLGSNCIANRYTILYIFVKEHNTITWYSLRYCRLGLTQSQHAHHFVWNCGHWTLLLLSYCMQLVCSKLQTFFISFAKRPSFE